MTHDIECGVHFDGTCDCGLEAMKTRVAKLEEFICHSGGLANEWARSCPFGTKMTSHIKDELYKWLCRN